MLLIEGRTHTHHTTRADALRSLVAIAAADQRQAENAAISDWLTRRLTRQAWLEGRDPESLTRIERDRERA